jgi:predicted RNA-binding protein with RPS1 domain
LCLVTLALPHRKDFMETVELDESTKQNLLNLKATKQKYIDAITHVDEVGQAILTTVINVKGLEGQWVLGADFKLIKEVESTQ